MKLPTIVVFNIYNSYNDFGLESLKVYSRGLAVALVMATMVLILSLGLSHGCGIGFKVIRPLGYT